MTVYVFPCDERMLKVVFLLAAKSVKSLTIIVRFPVLSMPASCTLISVLLSNLRIQISYSSLYIVCAGKATLMCSSL